MPARKRWCATSRANGFNFCGTFAVSCRMRPRFLNGTRIFARLFRQETELFFESMIRDDRNVLDLLSADYTFANERLAAHYGIPGVYGSHFRRIRLDGEQAERRGGILGHGSLLTVTSYPNRTSPRAPRQVVADEHPRDAAASPAGRCPGSPRPR